MFRHNIPYFIKLALENVLREQKRIMSLNTFASDTAEYLPLVSGLADHALALQQWLSGKLDQKDPIKYFRKQAQGLEDMADEISMKLWKGNTLNLVSVFDYANAEKTRSNGRFEMMLRTHYDIQRMRLLEQVRGARLLQNNSDLGDEVERVLAEYLQNNLDTDCLVVRGGHIFDTKNKRSKQMDIMVIPAKTLEMCPADTRDGKYNVLVEQVIAAISVKSTLTPDSFEDAWDDIQSIPVYDDKDEDYKQSPYNPKSMKHWPLCFIVGANSGPLNLINKRWHELIDVGQTHQLQLFMSLERGYSIAGNSSWPLIGHPEDHKGAFNWNEDLQAGIGLGWMFAAISARSALMANRPPLSQFAKLHKLLRAATTKAGCGCPTYARKYFMPSRREICGCIEEGAYGLWIHNKLYVTSLEINNQRLVDKNNPASEDEAKRMFDKVPYESRWFEYRSEKIDGDSCRMTEWVKNLDDAAYTPREVVFDSRTGEVVFPEGG